MPVASQQIVVGYVGDGVTTSFPVPFYFLLASDLVVSVAGVAQTLGVAYTVSGVHVASGGSVNISPAPAVGAAISILRRPQTTQLIEAVDNQALLADTVNDALDKLTMLLQYFITRGVLLADSDPSLGPLSLPASRANSFLAFDASGVPYASAGTLPGAIYPGSGNFAVFANRASLVAATVSGAITAVMLLGYAQAGDSEPSLYARLGSAPGVVKAWHAQSTDGAWWQLTGSRIYPEQIGSVGTVDDSTTLTTASGCALALGLELIVDRSHILTHAVTFAVPVRFTASGKLRPSAIGQVTFGAGFDAPEHAFIFDFSSIASAQTGSGLATAEVTARCLTPQMFGAVENSPSSSSANTRCVQDWLNAIAISGVPGWVPSRFNVGGQSIFDYSVGEHYGVTIRGKAGDRAGFLYDAGVASPNFKITSSAAAEVDGTRAEFYGTLEGWSVRGRPPNGSYPGIVLQFGETSILQSGAGTGASAVYFNGLNIKDMVVGNSVVGGWGTFISGFADCDANITSNCGDFSNSGSAAFVLVNSNYNRLRLAPGAAQYGFYVPAKSPGDVGTHTNNVYGNLFEALDDEVLKTHVYNRSPNFQNNRFSGTFAVPDYLVDSTAGFGNVIMHGSQISAIQVATFANMAGGIGTFGGYGFTIKMTNANFWGQTIPYGSVVSPALVSGTWIPNIYGQDVIVYITSNQTATLAKRGYNDRSTAGFQCGLYNTSGVWIQIPLEVKAGESFMVTSTGTLSYIVEAKE